MGTSVKEPEDIKFDKTDISAVANSRYFRSKGLKLLLIWAFVTLLIAMAYNFLRLIPDSVAYGLFALDAVIFVYLYSKGQSEFRVKLWDNIERSRMSKQEETKPKEG